MDELEPSERKELLRTARATLREYLATGKVPPGKPDREKLHRPAGSFVTLKTHPDGRLRGCIGTFSTDTPLYQCIQQMAVSAGTRDPRFDAVEPDELDQLTIEISVLSPRQRLERPEELIVGRHGVYITQGRRHGVLLPQVAVEHGWDRETFLGHVCQKAGLPTDAWKNPDAVLEVFTADVFGEDDEAPQDT
ncbi:MAG: AmmeMemoRadiSam system protein A [bacterium]